MKNVQPDPSALNRAFCRVLSVREFYTSPQLFVCSTCRIADRQFVQPRCPRCLNLMTRIDS